MNNEATPLLRNHAKEKLARGEPVYSMTVRLVRTVDIAAIAHTAGFDSVYIDLEHSSFSLEAAGQICMACNALGVTPLVRVPGPDPAFIATGHGLRRHGRHPARRAVRRGGARRRQRGQARAPWANAPWPVRRPS